MENAVNDLPIKNEQYYNYAFESYSSNESYNKNNDYTTSVLSEIFRNKHNLFEKLDLIAFGRIIYEMTTGKELKAPYPDELDYKEMDHRIIELLRLILLKKESKVNNKYVYSVPEISAVDLLRLQFFDNEDGSNNVNNGNSNKEGDDSKSKYLYFNKNFLFRYEYE
jgi:hypothetical protein